MRNAPTAPEKSLGRPSVGRGRTCTVMGAERSRRSTMVVEPKKGSSVSIATGMRIPTSLEGMVRVPER